MPSISLPEHVERIDAKEPFAFQCHPAVACFTRCCHELELALTPYDVLRLRQACGLSSHEVLQRYVITEQTEQDAFPRFYLTMVDDGAGSCVFLGPNGCGIYHHRPSACRTYPLGRATVRTAQCLEEYFVLLRENYCLGFREPLINTAQSYLQSQDLLIYNRFNDQLAEIIQHERIRQGLRLNEQQSRDFTLALYDLDTFRVQVLTGQCGAIEELSTIGHDDEALLSYGLRWIKQELFGS